jgi:hypothetical protein
VTGPGTALLKARSPPADAPGMVRRLLALTAAAFALQLLASSPALAASCTLSAPISGTTYVNSVTVVWTCTSAPTSAQLVWTYQSGPNTVGSPVTLTLALTAGQLNGAFTFNPVTVASDVHFSAVSGPLPDDTWSVKLSAVIGGVTFNSNTATGLRTSTVTAPPVVTSPAASTTQNTVPVSFSVPDVPLSGSVALTFTNTSSSATTTLTLTNAQAANFTLNLASLATSPSVTSVAGSNTLPDGTYDVALAYRDIYGHAAASTIEHNWTLDTVTTPPTLPAPTGGTNGTSLDVRYALPEAPLAGSPTLTLSGATTVTLTLAAATAGSGSLTLDPGDPSVSSGVAAISPAGATLPAGTYTATLSYQDALGNPAASTQVGGVVISDAVPAAPASAAPTTSTPGRPTTPVTTSPVSTPAPPSAFALVHPAASRGDGTIRLALRLPGGGTVELLGTHSRPGGGPLARAALGALEPGWDRLAYARRVTSAGAAGLLHLTLAPNATGRRLLARERRLGNPLHIRVWIRFTPTGGTASTRHVTIAVLAGRRAS